MKPATFLSRCALTAAVLLGGCGRGDPIDLSVAQKWSKGQTVHTRMTTESSGKTTGSSTNETSQRQVLVHRERVLEVDLDGTVTLEMTLESVRVESSKPDGEVTVFDSTIPGARPGEEGGAAMMASMIGRTIKVRMDKEGKTLSTEGLEEAFGAALDIAGKNFKDSPIFDKMKAAMSGQAFSKLASTPAGVDPGHPVRVGDSWERNTDVTLPIVGRVQATSRYTLKAVQGPPEDRIAVILSTRTSTTTPPAAKDALFPHSDKFKTESAPISDTGRIEFSLARGWVVKATHESESRTTSTYELQPGKPRRTVTTMKSKAIMEIIPESTPAPQPR